jgi:hypothetical protein
MWCLYFWRENEAEGQDLVGTCEWLSRMRASESQTYGVLVRFFPCRVYIDLSHRDTFGYEWQLIIAIIA